ncbi:hypothetical protein [Rhodoferax ferrireducens]|uniref:hypothetical protein n=1 Tax=Rhodoferax ferrireducens TaxID=192843 RepID=UPI003BB51491
MKALVECLIEWLHETPSDLNVWKILKMMATATLARADNANQQLREIEVLDVAQTCQPDRVWEYDAAKQWFNRANPAKYLDGRRADLEAFFLKHGHSQTLRLVKRDSTGHHRAPWYFSIYEIAPEGSAESYGAQNTQEDLASNGMAVIKADITYEVTAPGDIKLSWLGRFVMGQGAFVTRSGRGLMWAAWMLSTIGLFLFFGYLIFEMRNFNRPLQTSDLVLLLSLPTFGWISWQFLIRPWVWLVEDRICLTGDMLAALKEDSVQLDMAKDAAHRYVRLVRYSAVCPICAGNIELRYGYGPNYRRVFGCCSEVPTEHVFTFDRVTRMGQRYAA